MLYAALDLSRQKLDVHVLDEEGRTVEQIAVRPDGDALQILAERIARYGQPIEAAIESMNGARFVHDTLERYGWDVEIADAVKAKGLAPLAAKTDKIDARVLAELARRELVPAIWLPDPGVRAERERARFRLYLVRWRTSLKNRIHATLMAFGHPVPVADLFGTRGRALLDSLELPEPWATTLRTSLKLVDELETEIDGCSAELRRLGADHPYVPLLEDRARDQLDTRVHDRVGDRRYQQVREPQAPGGIHGPLPARVSVRDGRPPRRTGKERPQVFALGAHRGRSHGRS
jgi:transposase